MIVTVMCCMIFAKSFGIKDQVKSVLLTESVTKVRAMGTMRSFIMAIHENIHEGMFGGAKTSNFHLFLFRNSTGIRSLFTHPHIPFLQHVSSSPSALPSPIIKFLTSETCPRQLRNVQSAAFAKDVRLPRNMSPHPNF